MRIPAIKKQVLFLALLLCQFTVFAHVTQHAALEPNQSCQICMHAPGLDAGATAPVVQTVVVENRAEVLPDTGAATPASASLRYQPIRAPPAFVS